VFRAELEAYNRVSKQFSQYHKYFFDIVYTMCYCPQLFFNQSIYSMSGTNLAEITILVIVLLLVANVCLYLSRKINISFALILVMLGSLATLFQQHIPGLSHFNLTHELLFYIFLPALLFESAVNIDFRRFRKDFTIITLFATLGVVLAAGVTGVLVSQVLGLPLYFGFLFAAIISSTDPIAVIAIFKDLGLPKRLIQLVDSESMLNDATSIILANLILSFAAIGFSASSFVTNAVEFTYIVSSSLVIGLGLATITAKVIQFLKNEVLIEVTLTVALAYLTFIFAEEIGASGIIATVSSGMVVGNFGRHKFSPQVKLFMKEIWHYLAFIANSIVFFLIGLNFNLAFLRDNFLTVVLVYLAVQLGRSVAIYSIGLIYNRVSKNPIPQSWLHILNWGGLRGALPIAVVLTIPQLSDSEALLSSFPLDTSAILFNYTAAVVIMSLFINGPTIRPLLQWLKADRQTIKEQIETLLLKIYVMSQSFKRIKHLEKIGELSEHGFSGNQRFMHDFQDATRELKLFAQKHPLDLQKAMYGLAFRIEKETFIKLSEKAVISDRILNRLLLKLDEGLDLIDKGVFPRDFSRNKQMLNIMQTSKKDLSLQELFFYRKAREFANLEVLDQFRVFAKIPSLRPLIKDVRESYNKLFAKNRMVCTDLQERFGIECQKFERDLYYNEFVATEESILKELEMEGRASHSVTQTLQTLFTSPQLKG
jgi:CPA1 family monovalent cation:H+ antiporter